MTRLEALKSLLAKVEAGRCPSINLCLAAIPDWSSLIFAAFDGSLDAAQALHEAVLPEWVLHRVGKRHGGIWEADLMELDAEGWHDSANCGRKSAFNADPARAWLIAILKALIAKEEG